MVLTFDFAYCKLQREHPHKLSDYIFKERSLTFARQTHKYTGERGLIDSPGMPAGLDFRGLAKGHRSLSEQRIIATKAGPSTPKFNYFQLPFRALIHDPQNRAGQLITC